jgi:hypothetical protein
MLARRLVHSDLTSAIPKRPVLSDLKSVILKRLDLNA